MAFLGEVVEEGLGLDSQSSVHTVALVKLTTAPSQLLSREVPKDSGGGKSPGVPGSQLPWMGRRVACCAQGNGEGLGRCIGSLK